MPRKKVFGNAKKREQLKAKREKKRLQAAALEGHTIESQKPRQQQQQKKLSNKDEGKSTSKTKDVKDDEKQKNKLRTVFEKETKEEVERRKKESQAILQRDKPRIADDYFYKQFIGMPKRPPWSRSMSKEQLEANEQHYFDAWLKDIYDNYPRTQLNYFEHNLEVWRQLWRVIERSDILVVVVDARYPLFHFPPSLYVHVTRDHKKPLMLVLNKIDLVPEDVLDQWIDYFHQRFPGLKVAKFTSYPNEETVTLGEDAEVDLTVKRKKRIRRYYTAVGARELVELAASFAVSRGNHHINPSLDGWTPKGESKPSKGKAAPSTEDEEGEDYDEENEEVDAEGAEELEELDYADEATLAAFTAKQTFVTIGMIGHPNVGKSSLINGLMGKKVVSTSATPGHTKHLQTIFLSKSIRLCDCPGLTFPAVGMPKPLQILCGLYPIAQVREPYSSIAFLAERLPLEVIYGITPPEGAPPDFQWSAWAMAENYARKKNYTTRHGAWDAYRAANEILRDALNGRMVLYFYPPKEIPAEEISALDPEKQAEATASAGYVNPQRYKEGMDEDEDGSSENESEEEDEEEEEEENEQAEGRRQQAGRGNMFALLEEDCP